MVQASELVDLLIGRMLGSVPQQGCSVFFVGSKLTVLLSLPEKRERHWLPHHFLREEILVNSPVVQHNCLLRNATLAFSRVTSSNPRDLSFKLQVFHLIPGGGLQ